MDNKRFASKIMIGVRIYFIVIILFVALALAFGYFYLAAGEAVILAALSIYYEKNKKTKQQQITSYIENLGFHLDNATKDSMIHFPLPMTVLDLTGTVVWYNKRFGNIIDESILDRPISEVFPDIQILKILENKNDISMFVNYKEKYYQLIGNVVEVTDKQAKSYSIALYWIDRSAERDSIKACEDTQLLACVLMVDNYEDLIKNTPDNQAAALSAAIDSIINKWVDKINGLSKKYEKDKYYVFFENSHLNRIIEQKFDVLDSARELNMGNKIPVTLSIGIGKGESIRQSDEFARASIDMCLGRGGDQAVIKDSEQFRFFGGRSESFEKNTRVKARVVAYALRELMDQADEVFVMGHKHADPDSFGAAIGICKMAKIRGAAAYIVIDELQDSTNKLMKTFENDENYKNIFISESQAIQIHTGNSLLVVVDTHNPSYVEAQRLLELSDNIVLIDHHRRGKDFISNTVLTYHEPYASSTCEMVAEIMQYMEENIKFTVPEAQALYAGIALDTKNFSVKTGVRTFEAASFLRRMGVDTVAVRRIFQNDLSMYVKRAKIVSNAEIYKNTIAISVWDQEERQPNIVTSQAADELLNISEVTASFVLCRSGDTIVISGRSLGNYNVQIVLEQLGGGGHMTVAGAQINGKTMQEVVLMLKTAIDKADE